MEVMAIVKATNILLDNIAELETEVRAADHIKLDFVCLTDFCPSYLHLNCL